LIEYRILRESSFKEKTRKYPEPGTFVYLPEHLEYSFYIILAEWQFFYKKFRSREIPVAGNIY
jgi:hypothetical protein